ncbi:hypothetical protein [Pyrococcus kukulkanii]|uniref:hypothetical protein n=1 Tax=Pyrococcus kukulkanii TaxID=1609559 RepID=UPI00356723E4
MTSVKNAKSFLYWGAILSLLSFIPFIGGLLGFIGAVLYFVGLYEWRDVDDRPFTVGIAQIILGLFFVAFLVIGMEHGFFATLSFLKAFYVAMLYTYPVTAIMVMLERYLVQYFYEATGEESFLKAKKMYLIGFLTTPFLVGILINLIGRVYEIMGYGSMTDNPKVLKGSELDISGRQIGGAVLYSIALSALIIYLVTPHYDVKLEKGKVEVLLRKVDGKYEAKVVYHGRCWGSCIREISVDGKVVYTGTSYAFVDGKQIVSLTIPVNSSVLVVDDGYERYTFNLK